MISHAAGGGFCGGGDRGDAEQSACSAYRTPDGRDLRANGILKAKRKPSGLGLSFLQRCKVLNSMITEKRGPGHGWGGCADNENFEKKEFAGFIL